MTGRPAPLMTAVRAVHRQVIRWAVRLNRGRAEDGIIDRLPPASRSMLLRTGLDPVDTLAELREREPISRLALPLGMRGWLVTGYHDVRGVLADADSFSNDYRNWWAAAA